MHTLTQAYTCQSTMQAGVSIDRHPLLDNPKKRAGIRDNDLFDNQMIYFCPACLSLRSLPYILQRDFRPKLVWRSWNRVDKIDPNALTVHGQLKSINVLLALTHKAHQVIITNSAFYILGILWVLDIQLWKDGVKMHYTSHNRDKTFHG